MFGGSGELVGQNGRQNKCFNQFPITKKIKMEKSQNLQRSHRISIDWT